MADKATRPTPQQTHTSSAVIDLDDMEVIDNEDPSDFENDFRDLKQQQHADEKFQDKNVPEDIRQRIGQNVTEMMWQAGTQQAKKAWSLYGNIDILRPYFDVQPHEVRNRLLHSLVPHRVTAQQNVPSDLYGPLMVLFTLIALLLLQMKSSGHKVEEGTLMGTAFVVCFSYWLGMSGFACCLSYVCNIHLSLLQLMSIIGYGLFGHCMVVLLGTVIHTTHSHLLFYFLWAIFGGLSTIRIAFIILSRTSGQTQKMIVCSTIAVVHLLFLLYLHFAYHQTVEELSDILNDGHRQAQNIDVPAFKINERALDADIKEVVKKLTDASPVVANNVRSKSLDTLHKLAASQGIQAAIQRAAAGDIALKRTVTVLNVLHQPSNLTINKPI